LAGELAVGVFARMLDAGWIEQEGRTLRLSATGEAGLARLGIDLSEVRRRGAACVRSSRGRRRRTADGGALGAALLEACLRQGWLRPQDGSRALQV
ncbi:transcriptional regulator, partial [Pseudomonas aeruginosa]